MVGVAARAQVGIALCLDVVMSHEHGCMLPQHFLYFCFCPQVKGTFLLRASLVQAVCVLSKQEQLLFLVQVWDDQRFACRVLQPLPPVCLA